MKKKFMCLLLGITMLVSVLLTSCSTDDTISFEETRPTQTLVIYMIAEKEVSEKAENDVEEALNNLTQTKFKTKIDLRFFSEDEYYTTLEATMKAKKKELNKAKKEALDKKKREKEIRDSCKEAGISYVPETTRAPSTVVTAEETLVDQEFGIIRYKYPDPEENQVDIFYVGNYDKYQQYIDEDWLARLNDEVNTTSKKLKEHIPAIYMENIQEAGIYGIPNNTVVGEYTWMLLDKTLMDRYFCTSDSIDSLSSSNLYTFLSDVYQFERDDNGELTYLPIKGDLAPTNMFYWSYDAESNKFTNEETLLGCYYPVSATKGFHVPVKSIYTDVKYTDQLKMIKRFEFDGFFGEEKDQDKPFAMTVVKGGYDVYTENCENYYVKLLECPRASEESLYSNMFCVNNLEDNIARSMEIITFFNTVPEARNILQYGVENENYYIDDNGILHRYNESYMMDIAKTGNIFMAHPEEGLPTNYWENSIKHNSDADVIPILGFKIEDDMNLDIASINKLNGLADSYKERLEACTTIEEVEAFIAAVNAEIKANEDYLFIIKSDYYVEDATDSTTYPLFYYYWNWLDDNGFVIKT